ncbi:hypothetical protein LAZ67_13000227 [Cordylochernes scorpioides]|uniref:DUF5641 domain-containing protein n=1 Tax=Cordylochernes scorpioides TaxID=51811 RepID=A0ABY6L2R3_9ARAC|nr:hypothetical protein LAZ67_13000227 [Cordylochernes scorpioides]
MGRVVEIHPGKDGLVRVVSIRTKAGLLKRPLIFNPFSGIFTSMVSADDYITTSTPDKTKKFSRRHTAVNSTEATKYCTVLGAVTCQY